MKARIYINRHIVKENKKLSTENGEIVDNPTIAVKTSRGVKYTKQVKFGDGTKLIQDAENPLCSGATIWIESDTENIEVT